MGLDLPEACIVPNTFEELTAEAPRDILGRTPEQKPNNAWMLIDDQHTERPTTFAIKPRHSFLGFLQFEPSSDNPPKLTVRYRLEQRK